MKPLPTLMRPLKSADLQRASRPRRSSSAATSPRSRRFRSSLRLVAFELARAAREKFGGDAIGDFVAAHRAYLERIPWSAR